MPNARNPYGVNLTGRHPTHPRIPCHIRRWNLVDVRNAFDVPNWLNFFVCSGPRFANLCAKLCRFDFIRDVIDIMSILSNFYGSDMITNDVIFIFIYFYSFDMIFIFFIKVFIVHWFSIDLIWFLLILQFSL